MARLEGKNPNVGAIVIGAVIFALVAGGLFFAFRPVPEPTNAGITNSVAPDIEQNSADSSDAANTANSENSLTTILTPIPTATEEPDAATNSVAPATSATATADAAPATTNATPLASASPEPVPR